MNFSRSECKSRLLRLMRDAGAVAAGVTSSEPIDPVQADEYRQWIASGMNGEMQYLSRYDDVRSNPSLLLEGAKSVIVCAFPYSSENPQTSGTAKIARYALGMDYHIALRKQLSVVTEAIEAEGERWRVCVDTAPLRERLMAVRAGVGFIGRNGMLIVPGVGSYVLLCEVVTTLDLEPDEPCRLHCIGCGRCVRECPGRALDGRCVDASRCLSYLTIEYRGELLPEGVDLGGRLFGCDCCQEVCPHNKRAADVAPLAEFEPRRELVSITPEEILAMDQREYRSFVKGSAVERTKLWMLKRNAAQGRIGDVSSSME